MLEKISSDDNLNQAYEWLCQRRKDYSANSDVWRLRQGWEKDNGAQCRDSIRQTLTTGSWQFQVVPLHRIKTANKIDVLALIPALDALVLRAIAQVLSKAIPIHSNCLHVKNGGGVAGGRAFVAAQLNSGHSGQALKYIWRSDVKSYYQNIHHGILLRKLSAHIKQKRLLHLIRRHLKCNETHGGVYASRYQGLSLSSPLSPFLGALYLNSFDTAMSKYGPYKRFMDDWILFCESEPLRKKAISKGCLHLKKLGMRCHPDKTWVIRNNEPFVFLGEKFNQPL